MNGGEFLMNISVFAYLFELCGWKERQQNLRNTNWKEKWEQKLFLPLLPTPPPTLKKKEREKKKIFWKEVTKRKISASGERWVKIREYYKWEEILRNTLHKLWQDIFVFEVSGRSLLIYFWINKHAYTDIIDRNVQRKD